MPKKPLTWAYGVTTVPSRRDDLLPQTLRSLAAGGFENPRLFIDGAEDSCDYEEFGLESTTRYPKVSIAGTWILALWELYIRNPQADRYAVFEDDFVTYQNLKQYLESCEYPEQGYWNLYTFPVNQKLAPPELKAGWYLSNQRGKGAVALVFSPEAVVTLLARDHLVRGPITRRFKRTDGVIINSFAEVGWQEYVHTPSLVQHTGTTSTMGNRKHPLAQSFRGESFDALELVPCLT